MSNDEEEQLESHFDPYLNIKHEPEEIIFDEAADPVDAEEPVEVDETEEAEEDDAEDPDAAEEPAEADSSEGESTSGSESTSDSDPVIYLRRTNLHKNFECQACLKTYEAESSLKRHVKVCESSVKESKWCKACKKHIRNMKVHLATFHSKVLYGCDLCKFSTKYDANLRTHKNSMHTKRKLFSCNHCDKLFNNQSNRNRHMRVTHEKSKVTFECHICPSSTSFTRSDNLTLHLKRVHGIIKSNQIPNVYQCDHCDVSFAFKRGILNHIIRFHLITDRENFSCDKCRRMFLLKESLDNHMKGIHSKKFQCRNCSKILSSAKTKRLHEERKKCSAGEAQVAVKRTRRQARSEL